MDANLKNMIELNKKYNIIYADPPWSYDSSRTGRGHRHGAKDNYSLIDHIDLKTFPINDLAHDNCILFMWATVPLLPEAIELIQSWNFKYKTTIVREKKGGLGMGRWMRVQTEFLIVAVKGQVNCFRHQEKNIYHLPSGRHSQKPHFFRQLVEILASKSFTEIKKLELFARSRQGFFPDYEYEGWDVYGNQVNNSITL